MRIQSLIAFIWIPAALAAPPIQRTGTVYPITIDLGSTSNLFAAGHRIRVDISSSNFPKSEPNANTGEPNGAWTHQAKAHNTVYHDGQHPSHIELPVLGSKSADQ